MTNHHWIEIAYNGMHSYTVPLHYESSIAVFGGRNVGGGGGGGGGIYVPYGCPTLPVTYPDAGCVTGCPVM